jgi:hypothetical protein
MGARCRGPLRSSEIANRFSKVGFDEMRRMIREDDPPRPSHRIRALNAQTSSEICQQRSLDERHLGRVFPGELDRVVPANTNLVSPLWRQSLRASFARLHET